MHHTTCNHGSAAQFLVPTTKFTHQTGLAETSAARVRSEQADQKAYHDVHSCARQFSVGQSVMVRTFEMNLIGLLGLL